MNKDTNKQYDVEVTGSSFEKLRGSDKLRYTNFASMTQLDDIVAEDGTKEVLDITGYVQCHVINEKSDTPEYDKLVLIGKDGQLYITGSDSFTRGFLEIHEALTQDFIEDGVPPAERVYPILAFKSPSKNIKGKTFLCCTVQ